MTSNRSASASESSDPVRTHLAAIAALEAGYPRKAAALCEQVAAQLASDAGFLLTRGESLRQLGKRTDALALFRHALRLEPMSPPVHLSLATSLCELGARDEAIKHVRKAIELDPGNAHAHYVEALVRIENLELQSAIDSLRRLLDLAPDHRPGLSTLLYLLNLIPDLNPATVAEEHCARVERCYPSAAPPDQCKARGAERLRIGFLSADLRDHPVGRFVAPLFEHLDRRQFDVHAYSTGASDDAVAQHLRLSVDHWFDAREWSDQELEARLRMDRLDLLVEMSGHTLGQRLAVLARRPVPCQVSWLGYPNTTGLRAIDYRLVDNVLIPAIESFPGSETVVRLPGSFACFWPDANAPDAAHHPEGPIIYGSLHRLEKLSDKVVDLWAGLLHAQPEARLLIARDQLDARRQIQLRQRFASAGVAPARLDLRQLPPDAESHMSLFNQIDVLLDVFPWSGHTLACESLWMGVPVVTLRGDSAAGRLTCSALAAAGCDEWIASDTREYDLLAQRLASDVEGIRHRRVSLRSRVKQSRLTDAPAFARAFGDALAAIAQGKP